MSDDTEASPMVLTTQIIAAYVRNNSVAPNTLLELIPQVHAAITGIGRAPEPVAEASKGTAKEPAVPVRKSVFPDYIVCLEDGKKLKTLKRHLMSSYGMTPESYRARWNLPPNYPMTAPNYAEMRSALAKRSGLGQKADSAEPVPLKKAAAT